MASPQSDVLCGKLGGSIEQDDMMDTVIGAQEGTKGTRGTRGTAKDIAVPAVLPLEPLFRPLSGLGTLSKNKLSIEADFLRLLQGRALVSLATEHIPLWQITKRDEWT